jgi:hypothetical protein
MCQIGITASKLQQKGINKEKEIKVVKEEIKKMVLNPWKITVQPKVRDRML